jgi:hypothetical protein
LSLLWYVRHIGVSVVISKIYCCQCCDTYDILLSVLWYVWHIDNNMSYVSQDWQQYVWGITTMTIICFTYHNTSKNMSYASQRYQQYVLCITTLTTICFSQHNSDNNMSYVSQHYQKYVLCITTLRTICLMLSMLWHLRHIVVSAVIRMTYCCHRYDA